MSNPNRVQQGVPTGGQFAPTTHAESDFVLTDVRARGTVPPEMMAALQEASAVREAAVQHEQHLAMKVAATYVRSAHPTADRIVLAPLGNETYEQTRFKVESIIDADGHELATGEDDVLDDQISCLTDDADGFTPVPYEGDPLPGGDAWTGGYSYIPIDEALTYDQSTPSREEVAVALNAADHYLDDAITKFRSGDPNAKIGIGNGLTMAQSALRDAREMTGAERFGGVSGTARQLTAATIMSGDDPRALAKQQREIDEERGH